MRNTITSEILVAYSQCPRKAFLLLCTDEPGIPHEYMRILERQKRRNQIDYMHALEQTSLEENSHLVTDLNNQGDLVIKAILKTEGLEAYCDVLTQIESSSSSGGSSYEPTIILGTYSLSRERKILICLRQPSLSRDQYQLLP